MCLVPEALSELPGHSLDGPQDARHEGIDKAKIVLSVMAVIRGFAMEVPSLLLRLLSLSLHRSRIVATCCGRAQNLMSTFWQLTATSLIG